MKAVAFSFVLNISKTCSYSNTIKSKRLHSRLIRTHTAFAITHPVDSVQKIQEEQNAWVFFFYLRPSFVSSSEDKTPLQTFPKELLGFNLASSRSGVASLFFLRPKNFLNGWNLLAFFLSADNKTNTHQGLSASHLTVHWWITTRLVKQSPRKNEAKEQPEV